METNQSAKTKKGFIAAVVVLLLLNGATLFMFFSTRSERNDLGLQKTALEYQFKNLNDTLDMRNLEVEQYASKHADLEKAISDKQEQIARSKKLIQNLLSKGRLSEGELVKARDMIAQFRISITDMTAKIEELTQKNNELTASNQKLSEDLTTEKNTGLQLTEQNKGLAKKVELGSLLPIANLDVEAVKTRNNGKEVNVKRAKAAESLKISFETGNNKVIDPGAVSLYVRIINPKGETIAVAEKGSGTITPAQAGEPVQFTKQADFDYDQTNKKVIVYWTDNIKDPGTYKVELYQNGYVVGQGAVKLT